MLIREFELVNESKVDRALNGSPGRTGDFKGGVAAADGSYDEDALLAEYDRLGGAIMDGDIKVKNGSFYDFKARTPKDKPEIIHLYNLNGEVVEFAKGEKGPDFIEALKIIDKETTKAKKKRLAKRKKVKSK